MVSAGEAVRSLYGAYRLARFDADGLKYFNPTLSGFWRSFFAAVLVAPLFMVIAALRYAEITADEAVTTGPVYYLIVEMLTYVIGWLAFPVVMLNLAPMLDRKAHYCRYFTAYNWAAVWQHAVYLPVGILSLAGILPAELAAFLSMVVVMWTLTYAGFIATHALDVPPLTAAGLVLVDFFIGVLIAGFANNLLQ